MNTKLDENQVKAYLEQAHLVCKPSPKGQKGPDFDVYKNGQFLFYCEVKSSMEDKVEGGRPDPVFNRLTDDIHTAVKQFDAVNPDLRFPNVLAFVNHDDGCEHADLKSILRGYCIGKGDIPYKPFSDKRTINRKMKVHLYIWIDDHPLRQQRKPIMLLNTSNTDFQSKFRKWFEVSEND